MSPRPKRNRRMEEAPGISGFTPETGDFDTAASVELHLEEYEAIKLADYDNLSHLLAAERMKVSRPTFTRIYDSARKKVATAFVEHKPIKISGGHFSFDYAWFSCQHCGVSYRKESADISTNNICPVCSSSRVEEVGAHILYKNKKRLKANKDCQLETDHMKNQYCICPKCNRRVERQKGIPCSKTICTGCNIRMMRENSKNHINLENKKIKPMKKVAIPISNGSLSTHFGHSRLFQFFEIEDDSVKGSVFKEPPPHTEGALPKWLADEKVTDLLVGGIGPKAIKILASKEIRIHQNIAEAPAESLVEDFLNGNLKTGKQHCHH